MINRCRHLHIILHICGVSGYQCRYMADPESCPVPYEEDSDRSYIGVYQGSLDIKGKSIEEVTRLEIEKLRNMETETDLESAVRADEHLRSIGADVEHTEEEVAPDWF